MRTLIDTSSLVALARYYHPFDDTDALNIHLLSEMKAGNLILLDKIQEEAKRVSQGLAYAKFPCVQDKKNVCVTRDLMPNKKFYNMLDNIFVDRSVKKMRLEDDDEAYQNERDAYLRSADCSLIVYVMNHSNDLDPIRIMTEESASANDGKLFKKIPFCCKEAGIQTITAVDYLKEVESLVVKVEGR